MRKLTRILVLELFAVFLVACGATSTIPSVDSGTGEIGDRIITLWGGVEPVQLPPLNPELTDPDVTLEFSDTMIKKLINNFIGEGFRIPLQNSKVHHLDDSYIVLEKLTRFRAGEKGALAIGGSGKAVLKGIVSSNTIAVKDIVIQLAPRLETRGKKVFLRPYLAVSFLDIDNIIPPLDKALANLINELLYKDRFLERLLFDVTEIFRPVMQHPFRKGKINFRLSQHSVVVQENRLLVQAKR
ncbi:MAG: hypothetical protein OEZ68_05245 [Gammaproteobacteria bacterium]|nr:hypothetical protein [Gammaproteobacteria bacterium]MDH5800195.1 hypothetical protein [Gammaproteobacteria bacterium]